MGKAAKLRALGLKVTGQTVSGNTVNEVLEDFKTKYVVPDGGMIPTGGTTGQALVKSSNSNYATEWGSINQFNPTSFAGYDATKTQQLQHVSGVLTWVDVASE